MPLNEVFAESSFHLRGNLTSSVVYAPSMLSEEERDALRLWFAAFDPAVDVEVTNDDVFVRSNRRHRTGEIVRCSRTSDLYHDLNSGLSQLVERMS